MKISIGRRIARGFGAALLGVVLLVIPAYRSIQNYIHMGARVRQSRDMLGRLEDVFVRLQAAETGQRGYLLTNRPEYLIPYREAVAQLEVDLRGLGEVIAPPQREDFARLEVYSSLKMSELAATLQLKEEQGIERATQEVLSDRGRQAMEEIHRTVQRMRAREEAELERRRADSLHASERTLLTLEVGAAMLALFLLVVGLYVSRSITRPLGVLLAEVERAGGRKQTGDGPLLGSDEVAILAEAFAHTSARRLAAEEQLHLANHELEQRVKDRTAALEEANRSLLEQNRQRERAEQEVRELNASLERRVAERTSELQALNRELEAFTYSVSHDLRSPLRGIDGFASALQEDCGDQLPAEGVAHLTRIRAAANRMGQLIDDLLNLSRLGRAEIRFTPVHLEEVARTVVSEIQGQEPARPMEVVLHKVPLAEGDPQLLRVVLDNLLRNAWKFTRSVGTPRVEFGWAPAEGERPASYFVRDNGAGFNMDHASKLFQPFQRLHRVTEFPGTGIGLATVARIVHRHHGDVWAQGEVNQGATFHFTLPVAIHPGGPRA